MPEYKLIMSRVAKRTAKQASPSGRTRTKKAKQSFEHDTVITIDNVKSKLTTQQADLLKKIQARPLFELMAESHTTTITDLCFTERIISSR